MRMFDEVARTLLEVWYVLDVRKNLTSLVTLDTKSFRYSSADGLMKVAKENLVVMKAKLCDLLYILQDSMVTSSIMVTSSSMSDSDSTRLWHMRLGYMSEHGKIELIKRGLPDGQSFRKLDFYEHYVLGK